MRLIHKLAFCGTVIALVTGLAGGVYVQAAPQTIATLPPGAINNVQAQVIAKVIQRNSDLQMRVIPFRGNSAEMEAVNAKQVGFSVMDASDATVAVSGINEFKGRPLKNLRVAFTIMPFAVGLMVKKDSDIKKVADLRGRKFPTGWTSFKDGEVMSNGVLATAGLSLKDVDPVPASNLIQAADDFKTGRSEGTVFAVGAPKVAEVNAALGGIRFLSCDSSPEAVARMKKVRSEYFLITLKPRPNLPGIIGPTTVLGFNLVLLAGTHVPDDIVYKVVKAIYPNKAGLAKGHPSFNSFSPDRMAAKYGTLRYHPGAIKFYREVGLWKDN